jgi:hypothetical protein
MASVISPSSGTPFHDYMASVISPSSGTPFHVDTKNGAAVPAITLAYSSPPTNL